MDSVNKNDSNALVPYAPPTRPPSKSCVVQRKQPKVERKDPTVCDDGLPRFFLYHRLVLRDSHFKGKSVPNHGLGKVLDKMKKEEPDLVEARKCDHNSTKE